MALQLQLKEGVEIESIKTVKAALEARFPDYKLKFPLLNKRLLMVQNGPVMATVRLKKNRRILRITGNINSQYPAIMIPAILGILLGAIGMLLVFGIAWLVNRNKITEMAQGVHDSLDEIYNLNHLIESEFGDGT